MFGLVMAFQDYSPLRGVWNSDWVGLNNFRYLFSLPHMGSVLWNTVFISFMKIIASLIVPVTVALLLNEIRNPKFKRSVQTMIYFPYFISWTILAGILLEILSPSTGIINKILSWVNLGPYFFLGDNNFFPFTLVVSNEWKEFGFTTIIYLSALTGINPALYEAAVIDGANRWKQTWHITLPGILPIIILMASLSLGQILNSGFEQVYNLYNPSVYASGDIIDTMVYRMGLVDAMYGRAAAMGLFKSIVSLLLISTSYYLAYRYAKYRIF